MRRGPGSFEIRINRRLFFVLIGIAGLLVVALLGGPLTFRTLLPPEIQAGIARRVPIINGWLPTSTPAPTRSYTADYLPTTDPKRAATALALLEVTEIAPSETPSKTWTPSPTAMSTSTLTETATASNA